MPHEQFSAGQFAALLSEALAQPIHGVRITGQANRPYSAVWFIEAGTEAGVVPLVAKSWDTDAAFEKQARILQEAKALFAKQDSVCIPYLGSVGHKRVLFMPYVSDPDLASLCRLSWSWPIHLRYVRHRQEALEMACARAGKWLREWHTKTASNEPVAHSFAAYLERRGKILNLVSPEERERIWSLTMRLEVSQTCMSHGDFTPLNVLWSPRKLTVLDFGLSEWERMTPWWDRVSMEIGLVRALRFTLRGLGTWFPALCASAIGAFRRGYGESDRDAHAKIACLAVRHLVLYANDVDKGSRYRHRAAWHRAQLHKVLAEMPAIP